MACKMVQGAYFRVWNENLLRVTTKVRGSRCALANRSSHNQHLLVPARFTDSDTGWHTCALRCGTSCTLVKPPQELTKQPRWLAQAPNEVPCRGARYARAQHSGAPTHALGTRTRYQAVCAHLPCRTPTGHSHFGFRTKTLLCSFTPSVVHTGIKYRP